MRIFRWWTGLSPRRRILLTGLALVVTAGAVVVGLRASRGQPEAAPGRPGAVLLVPGYGGSVTSLDELAARIRGTGRTATVVQLAGNGTGDLTVQARVLDGYVNGAIGAGSGPAGGRHAELIGPGPRHVQHDLLQAGPGRVPVALR